MLTGNNQIDICINNLIDMVYVLSVKTFSDRIAHIEIEMSKHKIDYQFVFIYDIPEIDNQLINDTFGDAPLTMGQKSLVLKHIHTWQDASLHNYQRILVFEDDVILHKDFNVFFEKIIKASELLAPSYLISLGGAEAKVSESFLLSNETLVLFPMGTSEAYVTDIEAVKRRLNWLNSHKILLPIDHLIQKIDDQLNIINYCVKKPIVEQGSITGIFSSQLDKNRQKHSKLYNVLRYRWMKFQRHGLRSSIARLRKMISF